MIRWIGATDGIGSLIAFEDTPFLHLRILD